jgi:membrane peptidoglycan carboxypeptidase
VSNRDWPGPYWQEQHDDAGRQSRRDLPSDPSPWDDEAGFWRASSQQSRSAPARGEGTRGQVNGERWSRHAGDRWDAEPRRQARADDASRGYRPGSRGPQDRNGLRFSQAADSLRGRLKGRGASRGERADTDGGATQAWRDPDTRGYRGTRRAGAAAAAYGARNGRTTAQTALRERTGLTQRIGSGGGRGFGPSGRGRGGNRWVNDDGTPMTAWQRFAHRLVYGNWWRRWTIKKALAVVGCTITGFILLGVIGIVILYEMTPVPTAAAESATWQSSNVYFADHQLMGTFSQDGFSRFDLTENQIPKVMTEAITAAEDRGFYTEGGISVTGLMRAAYNDLFGSGTLQGGSTITMQYAKNYYANVNSGQNATTKLKEIFIAMKLAHKESKSWIMTQYLNVVPFGGQISGLGAAALYYFNINLTRPGTRLSAGQAAMLAAMPNAPGYFSTDPSSGPAYQALVQRYDYVLTNMVRDNNITQTEATYWQGHFPKITPATNVNGWTGYKGYLMYMVEQELLAPKPWGYGLTQTELDTGGYRITTTFNWKQVVQLAASVKAEQAQMKAEGVPFPVYDRIGAVLEQAKTGAITAVYGGPGYPTDSSKKSAKWCQLWDCQYNMAEVPEPVGSSFKPYVLSTAVSEGMNAFTSQLNGFEPIYIPLGPSGQMTLSRLSAPPTCTARPCQTVSYFKNLYWFPFTEQGENFGKALTPNVAAALSSDSAFEDLAHRANINDVIRMAYSFGVGRSPFILPCSSAPPNATALQTIKSCNDYSGSNGLWTNFNYGSKAQTAGSPAIALGESPLTAVEQATTFATLADDGVYHSPHVVASVTKSTPQGTNAPLPSDVVTRMVLTPHAAADADWALSFDNTMAGATGLNVTVDPGGLIAKTGTLGSGANSSQAWFNAGVPNGPVLSVALFANDPATEVLDNLPQAGVNGGSLGGGWPALIFNNYFLKMFPNGPTTPPFQNLEVNGYPFQKWVLVVPPKKKLCRPWQFGNGNGNGNGKCQPGCVPTFGQPCRGGPNPNPSPSCQNPFGQCGNNPPPTPSPNPSPSPSCGPIGPCSSPSPSPSSSPSPSCTLPPGQCGGTGGLAPAAKKKAAASASLLALVVSLPEKSAAALGGVTRVVAS